MRAHKYNKKIMTVIQTYVFFEKKCNCCGKMYRMNEMWKVQIHFTNGTGTRYLYYCKNCMHSAAEVLEDVH